MHWAIFSDIHSNWEALETAIAHVQSKKINRWAVLGDTIGYGANPNECLAWVLEHGNIYLMGNHEKGLIDPSLQEWFDPRAWEALEWTARELDPELKNKIHEMPYVRIQPEMTLAHGSLNEPDQFHYLLSFSDARPTFLEMKNSICFVGHTHVPSCFVEGPSTATYLPAGILSLKEKERYILNPGSVGQPRDRDKRLSFGIFDDEARTFEIVRLAYDSQKAAEKIMKAGLPRYFAERLLV